MEDEKIIELYWNRSEEALAETEQKYSRYLLTIANNILKNQEDSRESLNDTLLRAWNSIPPSRPPFLSVFLGKLIRQSAIDMYRKKNAARRIRSEYMISLAELEECVAGTGGREGKLPDSLENVSGESGGTAVRGAMPETAFSVEQEMEHRRLGEVISNWLRTLPAETRNIFLWRYYDADSIKVIAARLGCGQSRIKTILYRARKELKEYLIQEDFVI